MFDASLWNGALLLHKYAHYPGFIDVLIIGLGCWVYPVAPKAVNINNLKAILPACTPIRRIQRTRVFVHQKNYCCVVMPRGACLFDLGPTMRELMVY